MKLSVLVCSLTRRTKYLERLLAVLQPQLTDEVELLIETDDGKLTTGQKRNILLEKATGEYVAFVDDDDLVASSYVQKILEAVKTEPDVVGIHLHHFENDVLHGMTYHSLKYNSWWHERNKDLPGLTNYYRNPNHINPVKRTIALQVKFPSAVRGEDKDYSMRLLPLLKTEVFIDEALYYYLDRKPKDV